MSKQTALQVSRLSHKEAAVWSASHWIHLTELNLWQFFFFFQKLFVLCPLENGTQLLLSSLPFPPSLTQFLVTALWWECVYGSANMQKHFLTFPHPSGPGREMMGSIWPSVCSRKPQKALWSVSWKETGPCRAQFPRLKNSCLWRRQPFWIFKVFITFTCVYLHQDGVNCIPKRLASLQLAPRGALSATAGAAVYTIEVWS